MFHFGTNSTRKLQTCDEYLQRIAIRAINFYDFSVVEGHRDEATQNQYFKSGVSKVKWPNSKHNSNPSRAMDCYPYHSLYGSLTEATAVVERIISMTGKKKSQVLQFIREEYCMMAQAILIAAQLEGIKLRWGGDWDRDADRLDQTFDDLAHFELVEE